MRWPVFLSLIAFQCAAQEPLFWGNLKPGPYPIGYKSSIAFDPSRKYDHGKSRPILLAVWYPASNPRNSPLPYRSYLQVPEVPQHPWFQGRLESFVRDVASDDLFHSKTESALNPEQGAAFERLLATPTAAHLDAAPADGPFPVILYHPGAGGSFEDNSLLFEYLASHGFVVVSSAFQSPDPQFIGNNRGGIERSGPDLDFIARKAAQWPYADATKLAAIGHSAGAQLIFEWVGSPKCPARAFVSLDTTLEYTAEDYPGHKSVREELRKRTPPSIPALVFAQAERHPRFSTFDTFLQHSPHYEAEVLAVKHDDFLTHGFLGRTLTGEPNADSVGSSYEAICQTILKFLNASLKADAHDLRELETPDLSSPVFIRYRPAH